MRTYILILSLFCFIPSLYAQTPLPTTPANERGSIDMERSGTHDANNIRTIFYNYGMVGDYPPDPINVDLSVFHSMEIPKGSGENYSDGACPFVLAKIQQRTGSIVYIMETGYRERQGVSPYTGKTMRYEPRPGFFQVDPSINVGRSVAMSNDSRTWPDIWYDRRSDTYDPGWKGSWDGYFGKSPHADQESYVVYDDNFYDAWAFSPDSRDNTRKGLGLKVEQRGFQWSNPQAGNVIFFHYDISNESTTQYNNNIIFGLYMDSGVGGSGIGVDGIPESDDDNAYFDKTIGTNLVYTWDKYGHGMKGATGYLGYSYLETPGNSTNLIDDDGDGITDERRDSGPGTKIIGQDAIRAYVTAHYDMTKFQAFYGPLEKRPAYVAGVWWTGDEDMDWVAEFDDTGGDGVFGTGDPGELDGIPTAGEANFDQTDIDESDQIGLTGFKMNRIKAGAGSPSTQVDNIVFFDDGNQWPKRLYNIFTNPDSSFDQPLVLNYNIAFLFASGPFLLDIGKKERFSLALGFGANLTELTTTTKVVQQIYKANYQFAVPPPMPTLKGIAGDKRVTLMWDNASERAYDPITNNNDFEGYRIYRSTDPTFLDPKVILTGTGSGPIGNGKTIAQFDLQNNISGYSNTTVNGVAYYLGDNTGLSHYFVDTTVTNGQMYYYAVTSYDRGVDSIQIYPSENAIAVSQTLRGGIILPKNVIQVIPNPPVPGYQDASISELTHTKGRGTGTVNLKVLNSKLVPENHLLAIRFDQATDSVRAQTYRLVDVTLGDTLFLFGSDLAGESKGPSGDGILPVISTPYKTAIDSAKTFFLANSATNLKLKVRYAPGYPVELRRGNYPEDVDLVFSDTFLDTSVAAVGIPATPTKFKVVAKTAAGDVKLKFRFRDQGGVNTMSRNGDYIEVLTATASTPNTLKATWRFEIDTTGIGSGLITPATKGDVYQLRLAIPFAGDDEFTFKTKAQYIDPNAAKQKFNEHPYVVPNPYVGAASFEPQRYAVSGRGERKIEFRNLPAYSTIRIYTVSGDLVQTLHHDGNMNNGVVSWDLRNRDNLEIAPGLYLYHVDGNSTGSYVGKFAIIK
jgi:hypothetical protein